MLDLIPEQGSTHRELGYTYNDLEEYELALEHLNKYRELRPSAKDSSEVKKAIEQITIRMNSTEADEEW